MDYSLDWLNEPEFSVNLGSIGTYNSPSPIPYSDMSLNSCSAHGSLLEQCEEFRNKSVKHWTGDDCYDWALAACRQEFYDCSGSNLTAFKFTSGLELIKYQEQQFKELIDDINGPFFHRQFSLYRQLHGIECLPESSETQTFATLSNMEPSSHSSYYESADSSQFSAYRDMNSLDVSSDSLPDNLSVSPLYSSPHWSSYEGSSTPRALSNSNSNNSLTHSDPFPQEHLDFGSLSNMNIIDDSSSFSQFSDSNLESAVGGLETVKMEEYPNCQTPVELSVEDFDRQNQSSSDGVATAVSSRHWFDKIPAEGARKNRVRNPKCWEFILYLLQDPRTNGHLVRWEDKANGTFRLVQKETVARMWGDRVKKSNYTYESFARLLRHHYTSGSLVPVKERQMVYQFGPKAIEKMKKW